MTQQNKNVESVFFDKFGSDLGYDVFNKPGYKRITSEFLKYLNPARKLKIVDFGCGTGAFTSKLSEHPFELTGIDISPRCIEFARNKYPNISFIVGDVERTPFLAESFDVVICSGILHHFRDFRGVLNEARRILRKDGILLSYDPHKKNPLMWLYRSKESTFYSSKGVTENEQPLEIKTIKESLEDVGYREITVYPISGVTFKYMESTLASLILPLYNILECMIDIKPLRNKIGSFLITYAKI
jgi:ubiquinone/menaquinone biosynthesis C-methylase UbiE